MFEMFEKVLITSYRGMTMTCLAIEISKFHIFVALSEASIFRHYFCPNNFTISLNLHLFHRKDII